MAGVTLSQWELASRRIQIQIGRPNSIVGPFNLVHDSRHSSMFFLAVFSIFLLGKVADSAVLHPSRINSEDNILDVSPPNSDPFIIDGGIFERSERYKTTGEVTRNQIDPPESSMLAKTFHPGSGLPISQSSPVIRAIPRDTEITMEMTTLQGATAPEMQASQLELNVLDPIAEATRVSNETPDLVLPVKKNTKSDTDQITKMAKDISKLVDEVSVIKKLVVKLVDQADRERRKKRKPGNIKQKVSRSTGAPSRSLTSLFAKDLPSVYKWSDLKAIGQI